MPGAVVQVVARGSQNGFLDVKPEITHFKFLHKRHTIFACESMENVSSGTADFGRKCVFNIQRNADLIGPMFVRSIVPALSANQAWCSFLGNSMIKTAVLNIGGTEVEKHTGDYMNMMYQLYRDHAHDVSFDKMIANVPEMTVPEWGTPQYTLWIPLMFSICRWDGLAFPLVASQYHDARVEIEFQEVTKLVCGSAAGSVTSSNTSMISCSLFVDYVYLGQAERKMFASATHEYLIQQVQHSGTESLSSTNSKIRIDFNHPNLATIINVKQNKYLDGSKFLGYHPTDSNALREMATKRAVLAWATFNTGTGLYEVSGSTALANAINDAAVTLVDTSVNNVDLDNLAITGPLLPLDLCSTPVSLLDTTGLTRTTDDAATNPGAAGNDIVVRQWSNYGVFLDGSVCPVKEMNMTFNNNERLSKRDAKYFGCVQAWQNFKSSPKSDGVLAYSYALRPCDIQPTGSLNMSRIDNATIHLDMITTARVMRGTVWQDVAVQVASDATVDIYGPNFNVGRIMGGLFGLGYAN